MSIHHGLKRILESSNVEISLQRVSLLVQQLKVFPGKAREGRKPAK